jgi:hypothetical protein
MVPQARRLHRAPVSTLTTHPAPIAGPSGSPRISHHRYPRSGAQGGRCTHFSAGRPTDRRPDHHFHQADGTHALTRPAARLNITFSDRKRVRDDRTASRHSERGCNGRPDVSVSTHNGLIAVASHHHAWICPLQVPGRCYGYVMPSSSLHT